MNKDWRVCGQLMVIVSFVRRVKPARGHGCLVSHIDINYSLHCDFLEKVNCTILLSSNISNVKQIDYKKFGFQHVVIIYWWIIIICSEYLAFSVCCMHPGLKKNRKLFLLHRVWEEYDILKIVACIMINWLSLCRVMFMNNFYLRIHCMLIFRSCFWSAMYQWRCLLRTCETNCWQSNDGVQRYVWSTLKMFRLHYVSWCENATLWL